ncbi:MAG: response regulator [Nitrospirae bacterium]|nr:response regulator [Nitrospirota bacterium]
MLKRLSILYVDDDEAIRNVMRIMLRRRFGDVYIASNGKEGFDLYINYEPDMVVTDNEMPVMNGATLIAKIHERNKEQPIIMTKSFSDDERTMNCKVCANVIKPIDAEKLIEAICYCMGMRQGGKFT